MVGFQVDPDLRFGQRILESVSETEHEGHLKPAVRSKGIELHAASGLRDRIVGEALHCEQLPMVAPREGVIGIQRDRVCILLLRAGPVPLEPVPHHRQRHVGVCHRPINADRLKGRVQGPRHHLPRRGKAKHRARGFRQADPGVRPSIAAVNRQCPGEALQGLSERRPARPHVVSSDP